MHALCLVSHVLQLCATTTHASVHVCRVEKQRAEEVQAALQRAQQHILDLQEQHRLDLESCKQGHAAETVRLRSDCYSCQTQLAEARKASSLILCFADWFPAVVVGRSFVLQHSGHTFPSN